MFVKARLNIPIVATTPLPSDTELLQHSSIVSPDFLRKILSPPFPLVTITILFLVSSVASLCLYLYHKGFVRLWLQCSKGYKWASHQGPDVCRHVGSVRRLWRPALAEEEEDKLVEIRSIRPGWKSTQKEKETALMCKYIYCNKQWTLKKRHLGSISDKNRL